MTIEEHLNRIVAKCEQLLAIAEKRTLGEWKTSFDDRGFPGVTTLDSVRTACMDLSCARFDEREDNAKFIASCAGPAEAGWRATIAAIEGLRPIAVIGGGRSEGNFMAQAVLEAIRAVWPEELL